VGATTPTGHFLQTLTGLRRLLDRALEEGADRVVVDSPGYMDTDAGREFAYQVIDLLRPDHVVVIQRAAEMAPLLASLGRRRARPLIHCLVPSPAVQPRTREQRRAYRERKLRAYFQAARPQTLSLDGLGVHGTASQIDASDDLRDRLVALCDQQGFAIALGILEAVSNGGTCLEVYAPPFDPEKVVSVQVGAIRVARTGEHF
jgi:polynucleotide 5'-hydroxyl-kinase GRC3/NOL9